MIIKLPKHVAIIMDGNGRWAERQGLLRVEGHRAGVATVKETIQGCLTKGIPVLSLFAFSSENWARPVEEVNCLMGLFLEALSREVDELNANGVKLGFIGYREQLSPILQQEMADSEAKTMTNDKLLLNIVVNYGGKWDILQATQSIVQAVSLGHIAPSDIDEALIASKLCTAHLPEPDLFIRTSGEQRLSNFFLWSLAYTELYFSEYDWPDFNAAAFQQALDSFGRRERRFGQTSTQLKEGMHV